MKYLTLSLKQQKNVSVSGSYAKEEIVDITTRGLKASVINERSAESIIWNISI